MLDGDSTTHLHSYAASTRGSQLPLFRGRCKALFCSMESLHVGPLDEPIQVPVREVFLWCQFVEGVEQDYPQGYDFRKEGLFCCSGHYSLSLIDSP